MVMSHRSAEDLQELQEKIQRVLYREFLGEPHLYRDAGLDDLPDALSQVLACPSDQGLLKAASSLYLDDFDMATLQRLFRIRDMNLISRTAASVSAELKGVEVSYEQAIRRALCYGVTDLKAHAYAALRAAALKRPQWARHHYLYGLLQALGGNYERALRSLETALEREPYEDARQRVRAAISLMEGPKLGPPGMA